MATVPKPVHDDLYEVRSSQLLIRGKVMSQEANKLQMPFSANSIYSRDPISKMSINCRSPFCASNKATSVDINYTQSEINDSNMWKSVFSTSHIY